MANLINKSAIRKSVHRKKMKISEDVFDEINKIVDAIIRDGIWHSRKKKRKTVLKRDIKTWRPS